MDDSWESPNHQGEYSLSGSVSPLGMWVFKPVLLAYPGRIFDLAKPPIELDFHAAQMTF